MTRDKSNINEEDFKRYLENRMTRKERNSFEKELQKNPFDTEAIEGYEAVGITNTHKDLKELKEKILPSKHKNKTRYFAAAASILLIITAGVIWMQFSGENPVSEVVEKSENRSQKPKVQSSTSIKPKAELEKKLQREDNIKNQTEKEIPLEKTPTIENEVAEFEMDQDKSDEEIQIQSISRRQKSVSGIQKAPNIDKQSAAAPKLKTDNNIKPAEDSNFLDAGRIQDKVQIAEVKSRNRIIRGKVISGVDNEPLPGVTIVEKGTKNGIVSDIDGNFELHLINDSSPTVVANFVGMESAEFQPNEDSVYQIELESENLALDEVVVVGYEAQNKKSVTSSVTRVSKTSKNSKPAPIVGIEKFNTYLRENAILPDNYSGSKEIVKLLLKLNSDGDIISVENSNSADPAIFEMAKEILINGSEWTPEFKDGEKVESEVRLRIVFRKAR